jgi:hypothetical protein
MMSGFLAKLKLWTMKTSSKLAVDSITLVLELIKAKLIRLDMVRSNHDDVLIRTR